MMTDYQTESDFFLLYSGRSSTYTSARLESRWATPAGSSTVWSTASSLMVRCHQTRPLEGETTASTPSSLRYFNINLIIADQ